jgi:hypothetical protein
MSYIYKFRIEKIAYKNIEMFQRFSICKVRKQHI